MEQFLTVEEKASIIKEWLEKRDQEVPADAGGKGYPDPEIFALTDALNSIDGVVTLQSCSGHKIDKDYMPPAHLWIRLSEEKTREVERDGRPLLLAQLPGFEQVAKIYRHSGVAIWEIIFDGLNVNQSTFNSNCQRVIELFQGPLSASDAAVAAGASVIALLTSASLVDSRRILVAKLRAWGDWKTAMKMAEVEARTITAQGMHTADERPTCSGRRQAPTGRP